MFDIISAAPQMIQNHAGEDLLKAKQEQCQHIEDQNDTAGHIFDLENENQGRHNKYRDGGSDKQYFQLPCQSSDPRRIIKAETGEHQAQTCSVKSRCDDHRPAQTFVMPPSVQYP